MTRLSVRRHWATVRALQTVGGGVHLSLPLSLHQGEPVNEQGAEGSGWVDKREGKQQ